MIGYNKTKDFSEMLIGSQWWEGKSSLFKGHFGGQHDGQQTAKLWMPERSTVRWEWLGDSDFITIYLILDYLTITVIVSLRCQYIPVTWLHLWHSTLSHSSFFQRTSSPATLLQYKTVLKEEKMSCFYYLLVHSMHKCLLDQMDNFCSQLNKKNLLEGLPQVNVHKFPL